MQGHNMGGDVNSKILLIKIKQREGLNHEQGHYNSAIALHGACYCWFTKKTTVLRNLRKIKN